MRYTGFPPFADGDDTLLILGSFPSVKSREDGFFYGNPRNRFWSVLAEAFGEDLPLDTAQKKAMLARHGIALWDVVTECEISGSLDGNIKDYVVADLSEVLRVAPVKTVFLNGGTAARIFRKHYPQFMPNAVELPSTSPANARFDKSKWLSALAAVCENEPSTLAEFFDLRAVFYDYEHPHMISGGIESKRAVAAFLPKEAKKILDLGCGTGLELEKIFETHPNIPVVGLDVSEKMLAELHRKYGERVEMHVVDYLTCDLTGYGADVVLSVMSLHHFEKEIKGALYKRIFSALPAGGVFLNCDYIVDNEEQELAILRTDAKTGERNRVGRSYHGDVPLCRENEIALLRAAGFACPEVVYSVENTKILFAKK